MTEEITPYNVEIRRYADTTQAMGIRIQRLEKKIRKLKKQNEHYKEQYKILDDMIGLYPHYKRGYEKYLEERAKSEELKMLRQRVKEQSLLINRLTNEQCQKDAG